MGAHIARAHPSRAQHELFASVHLQNDVVQWTCEHGVSTKSGNVYCIIHMNDAYQVYVLLVHVITTSQTLRSNVHNREYNTVASQQV